jgi:hypothetical protein
MSHCATTARPPRAGAHVDEHVGVVRQARGRRGVLMRVKLDQQPISTHRRADGSLASASNSRHAPSSAPSAAGTDAEATGWLAAIARMVDA